MSGLGVPRTVLAHSEYGLQDVIVWLIDHTLPYRHTHTSYDSDQLTPLDILTTYVIVPTQNGTRTGQTRTTSFT